MTKSELLTHVAKELIENNNLEVIENYFAVEYVAHSEDKKFAGHAFLKRFSKQLQKAITEKKLLKVEFIAEDTNTLTWQRTISGTHQNSMQGIPPSHKKITWHEMVVTRIEDDNIKEEWILSGLMGQLLLHLGKSK